MLVHSFIRTAFSCASLISHGSRFGCDLGRARRLCAGSSRGIVRSCSPSCMPAPVPAPISSALACFCPNELTSHIAAPSSCLAVPAQQEPGGRGGAAAAGAAGRAAHHVSCAAVRGGLPPAGRELAGLRRLPAGPDCAHGPGPVAGRGCCATLGVSHPVVMAAVTDGPAQRHPLAALTSQSLIPPAPYPVTLLVPFSSHTEVGVVTAPCM